VSTGAIFGDWTHRRRDAGGTRALAAEVARSRPEIVWSWRPSHAGSVDQVRIAHGFVHVATMAPPDADAPDWEHATVFALEASTGRVVAQRTLPDPVPVAAMAIDDGRVQVVATRKGEPIFVYALDVGDLRARRRRRVTLDRDERREDVLDAWAMPRGALWLEIERASGGPRAYASVDETATVAAAQTHAEDIGKAGWGSPARDACIDGQALFAPLAGDAAETAEQGVSRPPALWQLEPRLAAPDDVEARRPPGAPEEEPWARFDVRGARSQAHALAAGGLVTGVAAAVSSEQDERASIQAIAIDRASGAVRTTNGPGELRLRGGFGDGARLARRPNGEVLFQRVADGEPCSDLARIRPDGSVESIPLGNGKRLLLDAALGSLVLCHHQAEDGRVTVVAVDIDRDRGLLGLRSNVVWSVETGDLGGGTTVYAGAGHIIVRGHRQLVALRP